MTPTPRADVCDHQWVHAFTLNGTDVDQCVKCACEQKASAHGGPTPQQRADNPPNFDLNTLQGRKEAWDWLEKTFGKSPLHVTKDGIPCEDQLTGLQQFKESSRITQPNPEVCQILGLEADPPSSSVKRLSLDQYKDAIRMRIAELQGRKHCPNCPDEGWYVVANRHTGEPEQEQCEWCYSVADSIYLSPDYPNDLDACQFELTPEYIEALQSVVGVSIEAQINATALQRCEARILMKGK